MRHLKTQVFASELLASVTSEASAVLYPIAIKNKSGLAAEIATRLRYIADDLSKQQLYQLSPNTQSLSLKALQDLVEICNVCHVFGRYKKMNYNDLTNQWPSLSAPGRRDHLTESPQELRDRLSQTLKTSRSKTHVQSIDKFCKAKPDIIRPFQSRFIVLSDELAKNAQTLQDTGIDIATYSHFKPLAKDVYPDDVN